jgi:hypothetical protein
MSFSEVVNKVIDLSGKIRDYYDVEMPKRFPNYPLINSAAGESEEDVPPPLEAKELSDFLASLPEEAIFQLYFLWHLGRWAFRANELAENYERLKKTVETSEHAVFEMTTFEDTLGDDLLDALEKLRQHKINLDKMPLRKAKTQKR